MRSGIAADTDLHSSRSETAQPCLQALYLPSTGAGSRTVQHRWKKGAEPQREMIGPRAPVSSLGESGPRSVVGYRHPRRRSGRSRGACPRRGDRNRSCHERHPRTHRGRPGSPRAKGRPVPDDDARSTGGQRPGHRNDGAAPARLRSGRRPASNRARARNGAIEAEERPLSIPRHIARTFRTCPPVTKPRLASRLHRGFRIAAGQGGAPARPPPQWPRPLSAALRPSPAAARVRTPPPGRACLGVGSHHAGRSEPIDKA
jgi:hypothetical protein